MNSTEWIEYLRTVDGPTLCNAIELLNVRPNHEGYTPMGVRDLFPEMGRMAGYAVTAHVETVTQTAPFELEKFIELYKAIEASPKPAVIVFQEMGGYPDFAAHCGEVMATIFTKLGAVGLVTDCGVRDIPEVRRLGFHYFARGAVSSHAHFRIVRVGVTVQVCGVVIRLGQVVFGDENGVLTIPDEIADRLPEAVETVRRREGALMEFVRGDTFTVDGFGKYLVE